MYEPDTRGRRPSSPLIQVWASCKCFVHKGQTTSELRCVRHTLGDNCCDVNCQRRGHSRAGGYAGREAAKVMIYDVRQALPAAQTPIMLSADKGYDPRRVLRAGTAMGVVPQVAQRP